MDRPPARLRAFFPNVDELWDPNLPYALNIRRLVTGEAAFDHERRQHQRTLPPRATGTQQTINSTPPESLRATFPNIDELWDRSLSFAANMSRLIDEDAGIPAEHARSMDSLVTGMESMTTELSQRTAHIDEPERAVELTLYPVSDKPERDFEPTLDPVSDESKSQFEDIVRALRKPARQDPQNPLLVLQKQVASVFQHGPLRAGGMYVNLSEAARAGVTTVETPVSNIAVPWNSCKAAATFVGLLACPSERLYEVVKAHSHSLDGLPSYDTIHNTPSTSLQAAFQNAKSFARGEKGTTSVLVVTLIDVHIFEMSRQGRDEHYTSFAHTFVLGIGPEGVIIWQGWGEHGYGLNQWISNGDARVRSWQEAGDFVDTFEKFVAYKGKWDAKRNKLYKECFDVDIFKICGGSGPSKPIVPKAQSWVRILALEDVKLDDIYKFTFE